MGKSFCKEFGQFIVDTFDIAAYDELVFFRFVGFFL